MRKPQHAPGRDHNLPSCPTPASPHPHLSALRSGTRRLTTSRKHLAFGRYRPPAKHRPHNTLAAPPPPPRKHGIGQEREQGTPNQRYPRAFFSTRNSLTFPPRAPRHPSRKWSPRSGWPRQQGSCSCPGPQTLRLPLAGACSKRPLPPGPS